MFPIQSAHRRTLICATGAFLLGCGEPLTVFLTEPDAAPAGGTAVADLGHEAIGRADAEPGATADTGVESDSSLPMVGRPPPEPPPAEPPEAAQPPPIIGDKAVVTGTTVETLAGSAESGLVDGMGAEARFHNPVNVVVGPTGDLYVADFDNDRIRRVTPEGRVTTLPSTPDLFQRPFGLAFDDDGRFFVQTDGDPLGARSYYTATIWRMDPDTGAAASLVADIGRTRGLAPLPNGDLLLTDNAWHVVRRLTPATAELREVAGSLEGEAGYQDAVGDAARFFRPYGVARLPNGHFVIADARNHCLREVTTDGTVSTLVGRCGQPGYVDGSGARALFNFPQDVAVDAQGEIYVTDRENHAIRLVARDGSVGTLAGDGHEGHRDGEGDVARFNGQEGIDVTPDGRTVYVADGDLAAERPGHYLRVIRREADTPTP